MSIITCVLFVNLLGRTGEPTPAALRYIVAATFAVVAIIAVSRIDTPLGAFITSLGAGVPKDDVMNGLYAICFGVMATELVSAPRFRQRRSEITPAA